MTITVTNVSGLKEGNHGFHIHGNGTCKDPGSHFNPSKVSQFIKINEIIVFGIDNYYFEI